MSALVVMTTAILTLQEAIPHGDVASPLLGWWRVLAAALLLIAAWLQGGRARLGGMLGLAVAYAELTLDLFAGDLTRGWAVLLLSGPLLAGLASLWFVAWPRYAAACATVASASLLVLLALAVLSRAQGSWARPAHITIAILLIAVIPIAFRLLDEPMRAPGLGLLLTVLAVVAVVWALVLTMVSLGGGVGMSQTWRGMGWPAILIGAWLLLSSYQRMGDHRLGRPVNLLGMAAGMAGLLSGVVVTFFGDGGGMGADLAILFLALSAGWAAWLSSALGRLSPRSASHDSPDQPWLRAPA